MNSSCKECPNETGGNERTPEKNHLAHPQAELGLTHMCPRHSGEMTERLSLVMTSACLGLTTRPQRLPSELQACQRITINVVYGKLKLTALHMT